MNDDSVKSSTQIIREEATALACQGIEHIKIAMTRSALKACEEDPNNDNVFIEEAVRKATAKQLKDNYPGRY